MDRRAVLDVTIDERSARRDSYAVERADQLAARRAIGDAYLAAHDSPIDLRRERGVVTASLVEETAAAREESTRLAAGRHTDINNGALEFPVLGEEYAADSAVIRFGTSPLVLVPIVRYLGMMPVLYNLFVTRAHNADFKANTAHRFHIDPEDTWSCKVFVHLTDVDADCGPFHALPADRSERVLAEVGYRGIEYLDDERVDELVGWDSVVQVLGPPGTVALADTTRCLHFGGRPRAAGKPVREMLVYQYLLPTSLLFNGALASDPRRWLPQLAPTGEDWWDALIGEVHI